MLVKKHEETMLECVRYAKKKFKQADQLEEEPCFWCTTPPDQITEEALKGLRIKYVVKLEFDGFHCDDHKQLMHGLLGPHQPYWSCCNKPIQDAPFYQVE